MHGPVWVEAGSITLGQITLDAAIALPYPEFHNQQAAFLKLHDQRTRRLWFLWARSAPAAICGCLGTFLLL